MLWKCPAFFPFKASAVRPVQISGGQLNSAKALFLSLWPDNMVTISYSADSISI
jgi:hypothetical protein